MKHLTHITSSDKCVTPENIPKLVFNGVESEFEKIFHLLDKHSVTIGIFLLVTTDQRSLNIFSDRVSSYITFDFPIKREFTIVSLKPEINSEQERLFFF